MKKIIIIAIISFVTQNVMAQNNQQQDRDYNKEGISQDNINRREAYLNSDKYKNPKPLSIDVTVAPAKNVNTETKVNLNDRTKYSLSGQPLPAGYVAPKVVENNTVSDKNKQLQTPTGGKK